MISTQAIVARHEFELAGHAFRWRVLDSGNVFGVCGQCSAWAWMRLAGGACACETAPTGSGACLHAPAIAGDASVATARPGANAPAQMLQNAGGLG